MLQSLPQSAFLIILFQNSLESLEKFFLWWGLIQGNVKLICEELGWDMTQTQIIIFNVSLCTGLYVLILV